MICIRDLSINDIKNLLWHLSEGRAVKGGFNANELRKELYSRTGEVLGYHETVYLNTNKLCECNRCELEFKCIHKDTFRRLPKGLGLCPKL